MSGIAEHSPPPQRAGPDLRAGQRRARRAQERADHRGQRSGPTSRPSSAGGRSGAASPRTWSRPTATPGCWPRLHQADQATIDAAVASAVEAQRDWAHWRFEDRAAVFLKAADLLATTYRQRLNAATMLGQSKTAFQAEIDSACELIDFLRFNVHFAERIYQEQPDSAPGAWNRMDHRPLEGFVYAITPFNFTAIGGNLPTAPALMGNAVVWKPSHTAALSNWHFYQLLEEAGLPPGRDQLRAGRRGRGEPHAARRIREFAGIHFTGSTTVFRSLWKTIGDNLERYRTYPRIVGETGGKDFIVAHASADVDALAVAMVRGAYEYQGQKCSAASRAYIPDTLWPAVRDRVVAMIEDIRMGDVADFRNFMGAVIDRRAFTRIRDHLEAARRPTRASRSSRAAAPTTAWATSSSRRCCRSRIPATAPCARRSSARCSRSTSIPRPSGARRSSWWTGPARTRSPARCSRATARRWSRPTGRCARRPGNFYVNDKPTGAVVGQQPFGGARASGTNDKAGSVLNLLRWVSPAEHQGDARAAQGLSLPVHGRGVRHRRIASRRVIGRSLVASRPPLAPRRAPAQARRARLPVPLHRPPSSTAPPSRERSRARLEAETGAPPPARDATRDGVLRFRGAPGAGGDRARGVVRLARAVAREPRGHARARHRRSPRRALSGARSRRPGATRPGSPVRARRGGGGGRCRAARWTTCCRRCRPRRSRVGQHWTRRRRARAAAGCADSTAVGRPIQRLALRARPDRHARRPGRHHAASRRGR